MAGASLVPRIPTQSRERKRQICLCPQRGRELIWACGRPRESFRFWWGKENECVRVPARVYMSEGGRRAAGMAEKRKGLAVQHAKP